MYVCFLWQGDNGKFELSLEENGQPFDVFEVFPSSALNEANLVLRVKNSSALDYEKVTKYTFDVSIFLEFLFKIKEPNST